MKTTTRFISMAAAALAAAIITACSSSDDTIDTPPQPENTGKVVTLKTTVGFDDGSATTRALTAGGVKTFAAGETMALLYTNTSGQTVVVPSEALTDDDIVITGDAATDKKSATFTFHLTEAPDKTKQVKYFYPAAMATNSTVNYNRLYSQQDGTLTKLASDFDAASSDYLAWADDGNLPGATLMNRLAILAITLKDDVTGADITSSITSLILSVGSYTYNVSRSAGDGPIYVAIRRTATEDHPSGSDINVTASDGIFTYTKTLKQKKYYTGNFYNVGWRMTNTMQSVPLTMEVTSENGGTIVVNNPRSGMKYSKNGGDKTTMTETTTIDVAVGDKVQFYGNSAAYYFDADDYTSIAGGTADVKVYGNIMSLVDETGYATATTLTADNTFQRLFDSNDKLKDASSLLLPAETLALHCYFAMFHGCSSLTAAPALPATTLAQGCYSSMFSGCSSLTTAPALPATTLAQGCYSSMFFGCTSLTAAPALPATALANNCYNNMFSGCTSLTDAPALPATTLATGCYYNMFSSCSSLTTAPALPATTLAQDCYQRMFDGCYSLTAAPELPATTLKYGCYERMFSGCTRLSAVTCLATNITSIMANKYTENWLKGAGTQAEGTKTFTKAAGAGWPLGDSGIPSGWTVVVAPSN